MKKFVMGLIVGIAIMLAGTVFADEGLQKIEAYLRPTLPITLDGQTITLDNPPIMFDGSTYLKLRDLAKITGLPVNWNDATQTVELGKVSPINSIKGVVNPVTADTPVNKQKYYHKVTLNLDKQETKDVADYGFFQADGVDYISLSAINGTYQIKWEKPILTISTEGKPDVVLTVSDSYLANVDAFVNDGTVFLKLSSLGLKASVTEDALQIDKQ